MSKEKPAVRRPRKHPETEAQRLLRSLRETLHRDLRSNELGADDPLVRAGAETLRQAIKQVDEKIREASASEKKHARHPDKRSKGYA